MNFHDRKRSGVEQSCASVQAGNFFGAPLEQAVSGGHSVSSIRAFELGQVNLWLTLSGVGVSPL